MLCPVLPSLARRVAALVTRWQGNSVQLTVTPISGNPWLLADMNNMPSCASEDHATQAKFEDCNHWCVLTVVSCSSEPILASVVASSLAAHCSCTNNLHRVTTNQGMIKGMVEEGMGIMAYHLVMEALGIAVGLWSRDLARFSPSSRIKLFIPGSLSLSLSG